MSVAGTASRQCGVGNVGYDTAAGHGRQQLMVWVIYEAQCAGTSPYSLVEARSLPSLARHYGRLVDPAYVLDIALIWRRYSLHF